MKSKINQTNFVNAYVSSLLLLMTTLFIDNIVFMITLDKRDCTRNKFYIKIRLVMRVK